MAMDMIDVTSRRTDDYARQAVKDTVGELRSDAERGLSSQEATQRLSRFGPNEIQEREEPLCEVLALRDGAFATIPARELVPGDVVKLRIGNVIPADVQLVHGEYLLIDQSALTGESLPVSTRVNEIAYASTVVKQGEMLALW